MGIERTGRKRSLLVAVVMGAALAAMPVGQAHGSPLPEKTVSDISRYCQVCWRNARLHPDSWSDATQEVFSRLLERVEPARWATMLKKDDEDHREFIRAIDAVKKRNQRSRKFVGMVDELADHRNQPEVKLNEQREVLDKAMKTELSNRQQRIVELAGAGWSIPEIARELRTSVDRVSDEKYKAIRKLRKHFQVA